MSLLPMISAESRRRLMIGGNLMGNITSDDRIAIAELFARYCHRVDHGDAVGWAALFTPDGVFEVAGVMRLEGQDQLQAMPGVVAEHGRGRWRHQITDIVVEPAEAEDVAQVTAYGLVTDWGNEGRPSAFSDYAVLLHRADGTWRIRTLLAMPA